MWYPMFQRCCYYDQKLEHSRTPQQAWLTLAMSSTLAGNFTLLGSAATLIVAEVAAAARRVKLSFMAYLKAGIPITILTMAVGIVWLMVVKSMRRFEIVF